MTTSILLKGRRQGPQKGTGYFSRTICAIQACNPTEQSRQSLISLAKAGGPFLSSLPPIAAYSTRAAEHRNSCFAMRVGFDKNGSIPIVRSVRAGVGDYE